MYIKYFLVFVEITFVDFFYLQNLCSFHSFLYFAEKECKNNFYNNLGVLSRPMKITQYLFYNKSKLS